jgi:hypothetical protein
LRRCFIRKPPNAEYVPDLLQEIWGEVNTHFLWRYSSTLIFIWKHFTITFMLIDLFYNAKHFSYFWYILFGQKYMSSWTCISSLLSWMKLDRNTCSHVQILTKGFCIAWMASLRVNVLIDLPCLHTLDTLFWIWLSLRIHVLHYLWYCVSCCEGIEFCSNLASFSYFLFLYIESCVLILSQWLEILTTYSLTVEVFSTFRHHCVGRELRCYYLLVD